MSGEGGDGRCQLAHGQLQQPPMTSVARYDSVCHHCYHFVNPATVVVPGAPFPAPHRRPLLRPPPPPPHLCSPLPQVGMERIGDKKILGQFFKLFYKGMKAKIYLYADEQVKRVGCQGGREGEAGGRGGGGGGEKETYVHNPPTHTHKSIHSHPIPSLPRPPSSRCSLWSCGIAQASSTGWMRSKPRGRGMTTM